MTLPSTVSTWLIEQGYGQVKSTQAISGGCINHGLRIRTTSGRSFFLKSNAHAPPNMFLREAEGLAALRRAQGPRVPDVALTGVEFLLLEDLNPAPPLPGFWHDFGQKIATLHQSGNAQFGFDNDNYLGSSHQPNPWTDDGYEFFGQERLLFQTRLAKAKGHLLADEIKKIEAIIRRLPKLIPIQSASLIHGDLWHGNAISDEDGKPAVIDPAAHYGWAEADLAMTVLFGGFPGEFYTGYQTVRVLETGWRERFPLYNLYHLLNHLNLFGMAYHAQVVSTLDRFA